MELLIHLGLEVIEDGEEGINGFLPNVGEPEAVVSLVDGGDWAVSVDDGEQRHTGGFGMGFVVRVGFGIGAGM
ncbi:hypothetical protein L6452_21021 [Arctium lappa]|uniref:Uncharacterized protein n=1 Tax=Arctium lappa TaxID=4217 RepID=A0ACB9BCZ3_ARCLA|nr:hypothetical protein L6452_21021 [Arctium lappa]